MDRSTVLHCDVISLWKYPQRYRMSQFTAINQKGWTTWKSILSMLLLIYGSSCLVNWQKIALPHCALFELDTALICPNFFVNTNPIYLFFNEVNIMAISNTSCILFRKKKLYVLQENIKRNKSFMFMTCINTI